jgi:hypothetical protein
MYLKISKEYFQLTRLVCIQYFSRYRHQNRALKFKQVKDFGQILDTLSRDVVSRAQLYEGRDARGVVFMSRDGNRK